MIFIHRKSSDRVSFKTAFNNANIYCMGEGPLFSRRQIVAFLVAPHAASGAGVLIRRELYHQVNKPGAPPSVTSATFPEPIGIIIPEIEIIDGIEVFCLKNKIRVKQDMVKITHGLDKGFEERLKLKARNEGKDIPKNNWDKRQELLDPNKRYLDVCVKRSVWDKFMKEEGENAGINLAAWLKLHIELLNQAIEKNPVKSNLRAELKRIIVFDDYYPEDPSNGHNFGPYPLDIDARWQMWGDYRGDRDPKTGKQTKSAYLGDYIVATKDKVINVKVDYALIHEWCHLLFNYMDEYTQEVANHPNVLDFRINRAGGGVDSVSSGSDFTPWFGADLKRTEKLRIRGYYTDPRGGGQIGYKEAPEVAHAVWSEHPETCRIKFVDSEGIPIKGAVSVSKVYTEGDYYAEKNFIVAQHAQLDDGTFLVNSPRWFTPNYRPEDVAIYPTNWYLEITEGNQITYMLNIPAAMFNLSKIVGNIDNVTYTITMLSKPVPKGNIKTQWLDMGEESYRENTIHNRAPYAKTRIVGTNIDFIWSLDKK